MRGYRRATLAVALTASAALVALSGCSWVTTADTARACDGVVAATAVGNPGDFSWTPWCGFREVRIVALDGVGTASPLRWQIAADAGLVYPPIRYGTVPDGALGFIPPAPIIAGQSYQLELVPVAAGAATTRVVWRP